LTKRSQKTSAKASSPRKAAPKTPAAEALCPCGTGLPYAQCCEPVVRRKRTAATPEELMRSRYSAYAKGEVDHILATIVPGKLSGYDEKGIRDWSLKSQWHGLEILACTGGGADDKQATVEFTAHFTQNGVRQQHHEVGRFVKQRGKWFYEDGEIIKPQPVVRSEPKVGRNDPCPCGSGRKYKKCCGK
jgi:SEC-C motif-containing protein